MTWYFEPHRGYGPSSGNGSSATAGSTDNSPQGLGGVPAAILQRHGARVLDPTTAVNIDGQPTPRSTIYRARTLLVPEDLDFDLGRRGEIDAVLQRIGMQLGQPRRSRDAEHGQPAGGAQDRPAAGPPEAAGSGLPVTAVLVPGDPARRESAAPVVIDAWVALQALQEDAIRRNFDDGGLARGISLEHLLVGSAITGSPISEGGGVTGSPISEGGGVTGPGAADSYLQSGGDARAPAGILLAAPPRRPASVCAAAHGRRPVVAVLDTGVRAHPWLGVHPHPAQPAGYQLGSDSFVCVSPGLQDAITAHAGLSVACGDRPRQLIEGPWDRPVTADPLIGELDTHTGHGTFIAGIVRQAVPDAEVLAVRIMHSDGIVYEGDLICALAQLAGRVAAAQQGDMAQMVDVVSLSLGYFSENAADVSYSSGLRRVIDDLTAMGVAVVAAAGNYATSRPFYPAAFAAQPARTALAPVISVGALNPNGSRALFSDGGDWVRAWATGAAVVSTFPVDVNGSREPAVSVRAAPGSTVPSAPGRDTGRAALDPDDYSGGFASWSGTSFAAPLIASQIAGALLDGAAADSALRLDQAGPTAAGQRMAAALKQIGWS